MPTEQPNAAATENLPSDARDDRTAAAVLHDEQLDDAPGGGGLGGQAAAGPLSGTGRSPSGTSPNSPIDVSLPGSALDEGGEPSATRDAQVEATDSTPPAHTTPAPGGGTGR